MKECARLIKEQTKNLSGSSRKAKQSAAWNHHLLTLDQNDIVIKYNTL